MPLHPKLQRIFAKAPPLPPAASMSLAELRAVVRRYALAGKPPRSDLAFTQDRTIPGPDGDLPVRLYIPRGEGPFPIIVYFHGGGWVVGDLDTQDMIASALAQASGALTISVGYRLAPEHPFPAAPDDAWAAVRWAAAQGAEIGGDPGAIMLAGDSAGAVLAAGASLRARDAGGPVIRAQVLFYGSCNYPSVETESARSFADGPVLRREDTAYFWHQYLGDPEREQHHPLASPMRAPSHAGLPPTFVATAEIDPSRDDAELYGQALADAGVPVVIRRYAGMVHGFVSFQGAFDEAREAVEDAAAFLRVNCGIRSKDEHIDRSMGVNHADG